MTPAALDGARRARLARLADGLIPGTATMPAPSAVGIADGQLDLVLASRPDLADPVLAALDRIGDAGDARAAVEALRGDDAVAHDALVTAIVAGYYLHRDVQRRLGYPGQVPLAVVADTYPAYVHEGLLERVLERGPRYRPTPPAPGSSPPPP